MTAAAQSSAEMRAWISGEARGVDGLRWETCPRPAPGAAEMLVQVTHAAINFSDLLMVTDGYQVRPPRPFSPGQEIAGVVRAAPAASGFAPGDRIAAKVRWGGFADYAAVRADMAIRAPAGVSLARAAALPISYGTALVALDHCAQAAPGRTVLVLAAAGGLGLACVEIAKARGARVIAAGRTLERLSVASARGADACVSYGEEGWFNAIKPLTDGAGADIIVDPVGGAIGEQSLRGIARDGVVLVAGFASGAMPCYPANRLLLKRASAKGVFWDHDLDPELAARTQAELTALCAAGAIDPLTDERFALADLPAALTALSERRVAGKLVLRAGDEGEADD